MSALIVAWKEIFDNLRDKQTVFYALLFGPVLLPLIIGGSLVASFQQMTINYDEVDSLMVANAERAPGLLSFLESNNFDIKDAPADFEPDIRNGEILVVLEISEDYAESLRQAQPAPLRLYVNNASRESSKAAARVHSILRKYANTINALRLQHRGIDPTIFNSLNVSTRDVSDDGANGLLLSSLLPFLFIMSMITGGNYLAVDTTAGERERLSLEPLLSLPVSKASIVLGKYLATLCFVSISVMLTVLSMYAVFRVFPVELMSGQIRFDARTLSYSLFLISPLAFFVAALLIAVSAITRSTKQAQTYLGLMMIVPATPFILMQFLSIRTTTWTMPLPMLSQYQLLESAVLGDAIAPTHILMSFTGTLVCALALLALAIRLYQQERILQ